MKMSSLLYYGGIVIVVLMILFGIRLHESITPHTAEEVPAPLHYLLDETDSLVEVNMFYKTGKVVYRVCDQPDSIHNDSLGPLKCFIEIPCPDNKPGCLVFHSRPCTPEERLEKSGFQESPPSDPNKVPEEK